MADPELTALLNALVAGQVKLGEGQQQLARQVHDRMDRFEDALTRLTNTVEALGGRIDDLAAQTKTLNEAIMRGFTDAARRNGDLGAEIDGLKKRVAKLERKRKA